MTVAEAIQKTGAKKIQSHGGWSSEKPPATLTAPAAAQGFQPSDEGQCELLKMALNMGQVSWPSCFAMFAWMLDSSHCIILLKLSFNAMQGCRMILAKGAINSLQVGSRQMPALQVKAVWLLKFDSESMTLGPYAVSLFTAKQIIVPAKMATLVLQWCSWFQAGDLARQLQNSPPKRFSIAGAVTQSTKCHLNFSILLTVGSRTHWTYIGNTSGALDRKSEGIFHSEQPGKAT